MLRVLIASTHYPSAEPPKQHPGEQPGEQPDEGLAVEEQAVRLAAAQQRIDLRVVAPLPRRPAPLFGFLRAPAPLPPERETRRGLDVLRPPLAFPAGSGWRTRLELIEAAFARALARLGAEGFVPDVIYAPALFPCGVAAVRAARPHGIPVSLGSSGPDVRLACALPETRADMVAAGNEAAAVLAGSDTLRRDLADLGLQPRRIGVLHPGVDLALFAIRDHAGAKASIGVAGPLVAAVGPLTPAANHALLIDALALRPDATLIIAGGGAELARLQAHARRARVTDRVRFAGEITPADRALLLSAADVHASAEPGAAISRRWLEALACGTPIVVPGLGPAREVVTGPHVGRLVREPTAAAIAEAIAIILGYPPRRELVRAAAERFSWERNIAALAAHLRALARA